MNKIEKAVEHFHYGITHDIFSEPVTTYARLAVDALREQAERSKGCCLCGTGKGKLITQPDGTFVRYTRYCDYCGKRLEVEHETD